MTQKELYILFEQETGLIARHDNPEYMDWLEAKVTSHNSDYAAALRVWAEYQSKTDGRYDGDFTGFCEQRLNQRS